MTQRAQINRVYRWLSQYGVTTRKEAALVWLGLFNKVTNGLCTTGEQEGYFDADFPHSLCFDALRITENMVKKLKVYESNNSGK